MPDTIVALNRCTKYESTGLYETIAGQFELLGGIEKFVSRGDRALLKPNFIAPRSQRYATQTHPAVVLQTARLLKDFGAKPFVGDSPAWSNVFACVKALRMEEDLRKLDVPVVQLDKPRYCAIGDGHTKVGISSVALDADVIINMPKFKTHQQLVATFAVKNMFGTVTGKKKALWHFRKGNKEHEFCRLLIDIYKYLNPALTLIDAVVAMDGPGPIRGRTRPLGYLIAGTDPIACEVVCSALIDLDPQELPIVRTANKLGFGIPDMQNIQIQGIALPEPCTDFERAELSPISFSLVHVIKSICKQIILLTKALLKKSPPKPS
jgi:uncharacterized protein (DUF362 family)